MIRKIALLALFALGACSHKMADCKGPVFAMNPGTWQPEKSDLDKAPHNETDDAQLTGYTVEQGGVVKVHSTLPVIRLRDGDRVLCLYNLAYNQIGNNPGTGTTAPVIERHLGESPGAGK